MIKTMNYAPLAPACSPETVQQMRDLWRPAVQADYEPEIGRGEHGEWTFRSVDYDSTRVSLSDQCQMYVIPPAVGDLVMKGMQEQGDATLFEGDPSDARAIIRGASQFARRFGLAHRILTHSPRVRAEFDPNTEMYYRPPMEDHPTIGVDAPVFERESTHREGTLGWTVPRFHRQSGEGAFSLLRAKNHLVKVHWYGEPTERLSITFALPRLNAKGREFLADLLVEAEGALPAGTDYDQLYEYHERREEQTPDSDSRWSQTRERREERNRLLAESSRNGGYNIPPWLTL
jgi:hypothetical protein